MSSIKIIFLPDSQHPPANRKFQSKDQYRCFRPAAGFDWLPQSHAQKKQIVPAYPIHVLLLLSFFIRPSVNIDKLFVLNPQQKIFLSFRNQIAAQTALPSLLKLPATAIFPFPVLFSIILAFLFPLLSFPQTYPHHHFSSLFPSRPHFPSLSPNLSTTRPIPFPLVLPLTLIPNPGYFYFFSFASFLFFLFAFPTIIEKSVKILMSVLTEKIRLSGAFRLFLSPIAGDKALTLPQPISGGLSSRFGSPAPAPRGGRKTMAYMWNNTKIIPSLPVFLLFSTD